MVMNKKQKNFNLTSPTGVDVFLMVILILIAILTLLPFYQVLLLSFSDVVSYAEHPVYLWLYKLDFTGYKTVFSDPRFFKSLGVTLFVTVVGTAISMFLSVCGAYVLSRKTLFGRKVFLSLVAFTLWFGGGMIPSYLVIKSLGLIDKIWCMILPNAISTYYLIIMKNHFVAFPDSLLEAAKLDGANEASILTKVVLPVSKPFMATFILFYGVERWNEWYLCNLYVSKKDLYTLQIYLREVLINMSNTLSSIAKQIMQQFSQQKVSTVAIQMAAIIIATVPILCVYPFVQKHFVKGVMTGSVKE